MFGMSLGHILVLLVVVLLFGAKRLPELGTALGRGMRAFRKGLEGVADEEQKPKRIDDGSPIQSVQQVAEKKTDPTDNQS